MASSVEPLQKRLNELTAERAELEKELLGTAAEIEEALYQEVKDNPGQIPGAATSPAAKLRRKQAKVEAQLHSVEQQVPAVERALNEASNKAAMAQLQSRMDSLQKRSSAMAALWRSAGASFADLMKLWVQLVDAVEGYEEEIRQAEIEAPTASLPDAFYDNIKLPLGGFPASAEVFLTALWITACGVDAAPSRQIPGLADLLPNLRELNRNPKPSSRVERRTLGSV